MCKNHFFSVFFPLSPDGSYTEDQNAELHFKSRSSEFDEEFDEEEPLPSIGTCKSLYQFQGSISVSLLFNNKKIKSKNLHRNFFFKSSFNTSQ